MADESAWRRDIKHFLDGARHRIRHHTGLYADEDLVGAVLHACRSAEAGSVPDRLPDALLEEARREVAARCTRLVRAADRFAVRDIAEVAALRAQALAAVDRFQDVVMQKCRLREAGQSGGAFLRRRAL